MASARTIGPTDRSVLESIRLATYGELRRRELPVGATAIKRKSVIWPWIAIAAAMLTVAIKAGQAGARGAKSGPEVAIGLGLLAGVTILLARWIISIRPARRRIRQINAPFAYEVLSNDKRLPIVLLRSFEAERAVASGLPPFRQRIEEVVISAIRPFGPAIAIGAPEDNLPELGAARAYVPGDNEWTHVALDWIKSARLIVMIAGRTPGLMWELERIIEHGLLSKTVIIFPRPRITVAPAGEGGDPAWLLAARMARAVGRAEPLTPTELDGAIAMFPDRDGHLALLRSGGYGPRAYRMAVEQAVSELLGKGCEAATAGAAAQAAPHTR